MKKKSYNYEVGGVRGGGWFRRRIYVAKTNNGAKAGESLNEALEKLRVLVSQGNVHAIAEALRKLVLNYYPTDSIYDHLLSTQSLASLPGTRDAP